MKLTNNLPKPKRATEKDYIRAIRSAPVAVFVQAVAALFFCTVPLRETELPIGSGSVLRLLGC